MGLLKRMTDLDYLTDVSWIAEGRLKQAMGKEYLERYGQVYNKGIRITLDANNNWKREKV